MDDPLFRAADEAEERHEERPHVLQEHTDNAHVAGELLENLREQTMNALHGDFFDDGIETEVQPLRSVMRAQAGTLIVRASRSQPRYRVRLEFSVRTDSDGQSSGARYEIQGKGSIWCESAPSSRQSSFDILPMVRDGALELDHEQLRLEIASAIRAIGNTSQ